MKKNLGAKAVSFPLPVLMIGTYDEKGVPNVMNVAWGGQVGGKYIGINISSHKTTDNLKEKMAFTCAFAPKSLLVEADYFGIASGRNENKVEKAGLHAVKSEFVDAPVIEEFPVTLECRVVEMREALGEYRIIGEVLNILADEAVLNADGKIDVSTFTPISYDPSLNTYRELGGNVGFAFKDGAKLR